MDELYYSRDENSNTERLRKMNQFTNTNADECDEYDDDNESYSEEEGYDLTICEEECEDVSDIDSEQSDEETYLD